MAPTLSDEIDLRRESSPEVISQITPPAVRPERLDRPFSPALPRTVAGRQRAALGGGALPRLSRKWRWDWVELATLGLGLACAALSVYRLFWAI